MPKAASCPACATKLPEQKSQPIPATTSLKDYPAGTYTDGTYFYTGEWVLDKMHGSGKFSFASGASYEGQWDNGIYHGSGTFSWPDGRRYQVGPEVCTGAELLWNFWRAWGIPSTVLCRSAPAQQQAPRKAGSWCQLCLRRQGLGASEAAVGDVDRPAS